MRFIPPLSAICKRPATTHVRFRTLVGQSRVTFARNITQVRSSSRTGGELFRDYLRISDDDDDDDDRWQNFEELASAHRDSQISPFRWKSLTGPPDDGTVSMILLRTILPSYCRDRHRFLSHVRPARSTYGRVYSNAK